MTSSSEIATLLGGMKAVLIPMDMDPRKIGEALLAYDHELSREEVRLVRLIVAGLTNDEIAGKLDLAETTAVKHRIQTLYNKLGVSRRTEAVVVATKYGLWPEEVPPKRESSPH